MTRFSTWLVTSTLCLAMGAVFPAAEAEGCNFRGEGSGSCAFSCPGTDNSVGVSASVSSPFLQWRTIEGRASCGSGLSAFCAGHGSCQGSGYGAYGSGSCIIKTGQGVDFTGGCTANAMAGVGVPDLDDLPSLDDIPEIPEDPGPGGGCKANMMLAPKPGDLLGGCGGG
ncbi:MAG TPA: hypothetical protein VHH36_00490, partial [Candidatus Thermoplasmatota archaeon]|nr:hypothetical protein [Candidatus Thermoplasmatota archaeon]